MPEKQPVVIGNLNSFNKDRHEITKESRRKHNIATTFRKQDPSLSSYLS
jgi:hypothetical protein